MRQGALPAYRLPASGPKGVVVIFGGFDSFIEEFLPVVFAVRDAGYELIAFEGPGQGGALVRYILPGLPGLPRCAGVIVGFVLAEGSRLLRHRFRQDLRPGTED